MGEAHLTPTHELSTSDALICTLKYPVVSQIANFLHFYVPYGRYHIHTLNNTPTEYTPNKMHKQDARVLYGLRTLHARILGQRMRVKCV